jgi:dUTP pyrophosphatase
MKQVNSKGDINIGSQQAGETIVNYVHVVDPNNKTNMYSQGVLTTTNDTSSKNISIGFSSGLANCTADNMSPMGPKGWSDYVTTEYVQTINMGERNVEVLNTDQDIKLPEHETEGSAGADIRALTEYPIIIEPGKVKLVPTGIFAAVTQGFKLEIYPRSGLAFKHSVTVCNAPGLIDSDYRNEIKVLLINHGDKAFTVNNGDRIAQFVLSEYAQIKWVPVDKLSETSRGLGGFGSTGVK